MGPEKENEILQKGLDLILPKGYCGTGIQEIADAAEIPKGSFYNYFESKNFPGRKMPHRMAKISPGP